MINCNSAWRIPNKSSDKSRTHKLLVALTSEHVTIYNEECRLCSYSSFSVFLSSCHFLFLRSEYSSADLALNLKQLLYTYCFLFICLNESLIYSGPCRLNTTLLRHTVRNYCTIVCILSNCPIAHFNLLICQNCFVGIVTGYKLNDRGSITGKR
jgi:biotin synthase-related radical SAM superfamily protein